MDRLKVVGPKGDLLPEERKYSLIHSDETGLRTLFISDTYANEHFTPLKDEVLGHWQKGEGNWRLIAQCFLHSPTSAYGEEKRFVIFKRHMERALAAMVVGDGKFIQDHNLSQAPVQVQFIGQSQTQAEDYGKVADYLEDTR